MILQWLALLHTLHLRQGAQALPAGDDVMAGISRYLHMCCWGALGQHQLPVSHCMAGPSKKSCCNHAGSRSGSSFWQHRAHGRTSMNMRLCLVIIIHFSLSNLRTDPNRPAHLCRTVKQTYKEHKD